MRALHFHPLWSKLVVLLKKKIVEWKFKFEMYDSSVICYFSRICALLLLVLFNFCSETSVKRLECLFYLLYVRQQSTFEAFDVRCCVICLFCLCIVQLLFDTIYIYIWVWYNSCFDVVVFFVFNRFTYLKRTPQNIKYQSKRLLKEMALGNSTKMTFQRKATFSQINSQLFYLEISLLSNIWIQEPPSWEPLTCSLMLPLHSELNYCGCSWSADWKQMNLTLTLCLFKMLFHL